MLEEDLYNERINDKLKGSQDFKMVKTGSFYKEAFYFFYNTF